MALAPVFVELRATIGEFQAKMGEAQSEVKKLSTEGAGHFKKLQEVGKAALLGVAGAGLALGTMAVKAAIEGEQAHARLAQAIKNTGGSMEELEPQVAKLSGSMAKFGFTNDEVETALGQMTTSLHDPKKAIDAMGLAADLAKFKNISLSDASLTVAKAMEGQLRPLKQLGIDLPVAAGGALKLEQAHAGLAKAQEKVAALLAAVPGAAEAGSKAHKQYEAAVAAVAVAQGKLTAVQGTATEITKGLSEAVGGQASASAATFAGKVDALKAQTENLVEKLGMALLPVIEQVIGKTIEVIGWFQKHKDIAAALGILVGGALTVAIGVYLVGALEKVTKALTLTGKAAQLFGAQAAEGEAAAELPLLPWIAAVVAVGVAAYELYKHWNDIWSFIKKLTSEAVGFVKSHLMIFAAALGPIGIAAALLYKNWDSVWSGIKSVVSSVWDFIKPILDSIGGAVSSVSSAIGKLSGAAGAVKSIGGAIGGALGHIPGFAVGTDYAPGGTALVGENGPELVNLPRGSQVVPNNKIGGGGNVTINVHIAGSVTSERDLTEAIRTNLLQQSRRVGSLGLA